MVFEPAVFILRHHSEALISRTFSKNGECKTSKIDWVFRFMAEYGENGHGSAPPQPVLADDSTPIQLVLTGDFLNSIVHKDVQVQHNVYPFLANIIGSLGNSRLEFAQ